MSSKNLRLETLQQEILALRNFPLRKTAQNLVFGKGNPDADIFFIGEAPGKQEDVQGIPFVGAAGKQLDALLQSIDLKLEDIYIANILKYRPPENRNPNPRELKTHTPFLVRQIGIIQPKIIVTLGNFATKFILAGMDVEKMDTITGISQLHGRPQTIACGGRSSAIIPLYHPAAMLYNGSLRKVMQKDFKIIKTYLKKNNLTKEKERCCQKIGKGSVLL